MRPLNLASERERVIAAATSGRLLAPNFVYADTDLDGDSMVTDASELLRVTGGSRTEWDDLVHKEVREHLRAVEAAQSHDAGMISALTRSRYGKPSEGLIALARSVVSESLAPAPGEEVLTAADAAVAFTDAIASFGFLGWAVKVVRDLHARVAVDSANKTLKVAESASFSPASIQRLVVHEVGTHVLRTTNAEQQKLRLLALPLGAAEPTEEGLAVLNEARAGLLDPRDLRKYSLRALAASWADEDGFVGVLERLLEFTDERSAVEIAIRAKRGMHDLVRPGAHWKDVSYLGGFINLVFHFRTNPDDYALLMLVKQPVERLPLLRAALDAGDINYCPSVPAEMQPFTSDVPDFFAKYGQVASFERALEQDDQLIQQRGGAEVASTIISLHRGRSNSVDRAENRHIVGDVVLDEAEVSSTLEFVNCTITGKFSARYAALKSLRFVDCEIGGIDLWHSRIDGDLVIENSVIGNGAGSALTGIGAQITGNIAADRRPSRFRGVVDLAFAHIGGRIELKDATIEGAEQVLTNGDRADLGLVITRATAVGGLRLRGAKVMGQIRGSGFRSDAQVNLTECRVEYPGNKAILFQRGIFATTVLARGMDVAGKVDFGGSVINGSLVLEGLCVRDPLEGEALNLNDVRCEHLKLRGTPVGDPKHELTNRTLFDEATPRDGQRRSTLDGALTMRSAVVKERVELDAVHVRSTGVGIDFSGAEIGQLLARLLTVESKEQRAVDAESCVVEGRVDLKDSDFAGTVVLNNAKVGGFVSFRRCAWHGDGPRVRVSLRAAKIGQDADFRGVRLPAGSRIDASGFVVLGTMWWRDIPQPPHLNLDSASIHELDDEIGSWPPLGQLNLQGCHIDQFAHGGWDPETVDLRLQWVARQQPFAPEAYQMLASHYRGSGSESAARRVLLKLFREEAKAQTSRVRRFWRTVWYSLTGYGYRLAGVAWLAVAVIALSVITAFWAESTHALVPTDSASTATIGVCTSAYPCFDPLLFGVDAAVPIVDLYHSGFWVPDRSTPSGALYDALLALWAILGWVTITIAASGIAQRITR